MSRRWGNPLAARAYVGGMPIKALAKELRCSERTAKDWFSGARPMPWWVPELLRLRAEEEVRLRQQWHRLQSEEPKRAVG